MYRIATSIIIGILVVANVFVFIEYGDTPSSNDALISKISSPTPSPSPLSTPTISNLPGYDLVYPDLASDVKSVYGKDLLKTTVQDLNDLFGEDKAPNPFVIKAGSYKFSFSKGTVNSLYDNVSASNSFEDLKILKNNKVVFEDTTENPEGHVQRFVTVAGANYGGKSYYLIEGWSGGAHCCEYFYPIVIDGADIKIGDQFDNEHEGDYGFFVKNGNVYVWMQNSNFSYFLTDYNGSNAAFFPSFYRIDMATDNLVSSDNEFKAFYAQFIKQKASEVEKLKKNHFDEDTKYRWQPVLVARAIYQLKSGQNEDEVMKQFDIDFRILKEKYGISEHMLPYSLDKIRQDILNGALGERYGGKI